MAEYENERGEQHWTERPACDHPECTASALSFARRCWAHLGDQEAYLAEVARRGASLEGLAGLNLQGVRLGGVPRPRANFAGALLRGADFSDGDFEGADFAEADLEGATFRNAGLAGADFSAANLSFANLRGADLTNATFEGASLSHSDLTNAKLARADFAEADLSSASLKGADLNGAAFRRASFRLADLDGARLAGARFENCDVARADLRRADMFGALFRETDVGRAALPENLAVVNDQAGRFDEAAEVYAELKVNFRQFGRFNLAETALYREMAAKRRDRLAQRRVWLPFALARHALERVFLDYYTGYGTKPWRIAYSLAAAWLGFAFYYYLLPLFGRMNAGIASYVDPGGAVPPLADLSWASLQRCLYFSFVTLTKLGFTSYEPYGWAKVAAGLEGSFAIVSYTLLLVSIVRKIWR